MDTDATPRHLVLGEIGFTNVANKLKARLAEIESWRETSLGTDSPKGQARRVFRST